MSKYICNICLKDFKVKSHYDEHKYKRKKTCISPNILSQKLSKNNISIQLENNKKSEKQNINIVNNKSCLCKYCNKILSNKYNVERHMLICKIIKQEVIKNNENAMLKEEIAILKKQMSEIINNVNNINNDIINDIIKIDTKQTNNTNKKIVNIIDDEKDEINEVIKPISLRLNNIVILSRSKDNYINATQLCKACDKNLSNWILLDSTKELIKILELKDSIPALEINKEKYLDSSKISDTFSAIYFF